MSDTNEDMQDRLLELWEKYKFHLITVLLMVVSGIAGLSYQTIRSSQLREQAGHDLFAIIHAAENDDLAAASESLARIDGADFPQIYNLGLLALADAQHNADDAPDIAAAVKSLEAAVKTQDDVGLRLLTILRLAESLIDLDRTDDALVLLEKEEPSNTFPTMKMLFIERRGDAYLASGQASKAQDSYLLARGIATDAMRSHLPLLAIKLGAALSTPEQVNARTDVNVDGGTDAGNDASADVNASTDSNTDGRTDASTEAQ